MWRRAGPYIIVAVAAVVFLIGRYVNRGTVRMIDREAPRFVLPVLGEEGKAVDSADFRGRVLALVFWQDRGDPVDHALRFWNDMYKKHKGQGLFVLGISMQDDPKAALACLQRLGVTFPQADGIAQISAGGESGVKAYQSGVPGVPTSFVVDRDGWIRHHHVGWLEGSAAKCREWALRVLKQEPTPAPSATSPPPPPPPPAPDDASDAP